MEDGDTIVSAEDGDTIVCLLSVNSDNQYKWVTTVHSGRRYTAELDTYSEHKTRVVK